MPQPFDNLTSTTIEGLLHYDNAVTSGVFAILVPVTFALVAFFALGGFRTEQKMTAASFFGASIASIFWVMGELAWTMLAIWLVFLVGSSAFLIKANRG
jgi:uncharacterized membrane protein